VCGGDGVEVADGLTQGSAISAKADIYRERQDVKAAWILRVARVGGFF
jgi:hypothetical protein